MQDIRVTQEKSALMAIKIRVPEVLKRKENQTKAPGQGLVEFALVIPIFLLLVMGIIEFGHLFSVVISTYTASREATRYGTAVGPNDLGVPHYLDCAGIQATAMRLGAMGGVDAYDVEIRYDHGPDDSRSWNQLPDCPLTDDEIASISLGDRMVVRATGDFKPFFVNLPSFPITSEASRTIIKDVDIKGTSAPSPTPVNSRTPTTTVTSTQTSTPTQTRTPAATATMTETPIFTYTPTETATKTEIPTITPTFTATPTAVVNCSDYVSYSPQFASSKEVVYPLWNLGAAPTKIVAVSLLWTQNKTLKELTLIDGFQRTLLADWQGSADGQVLWQIGSANGVQFGTNRRIDLRATFQASISSPPPIAVALENGCVIRYPNWSWQD
jgi:hypothetical protein